MEIRHFALQHRADLSCFQIKAKKNTSFFAVILFTSKRRGWVNELNTISFYLRASVKHRVLWLNLIIIAGIQPKEYDKHSGQFSRIQL